MYSVQYLEEVHLLEGCIDHIVVRVYRTVVVDQVLTLLTENSTLVLAKYTST